MTAPVYSQLENEIKPSRSRDLIFRNAKKKDPCPCCNNSHGCKIGSEGVGKPDTEVWCLRVMGASDAPEDWYWVRPLRNGMGSKLTRKGLAPAPKNHHWEDRIGDRTIEKLSPLRVLNRQERDFNYQQIWSVLPLSDEHRTKLRQKRGLTDEEIEWAGFRSWIPNKSVRVSGNLPGVNLRGTRLIGTRGFAIPCRDPKGRITGFQIANDDAEKHGKYTWGSSVQRNSEKVNIGGNGPQLLNGEMPIACWIPKNPKLGLINLCEGGLKSAIAAAKSGEIFLGCASNAHYGPATLKQYLKEIASLPGFEKPRIRLWPDAGAVENRGGIPYGNFKVLRMCQHWGYKIEVAWWGQQTKSAAPDVDDLLVEGRADEVRFIAPEEFIELHTPAIKEKLLQKEQRAGLRIGDAPALDPFPKGSGREKMEYLVSDRSSVWQAIAQDYRYILDTSGTGTGKSHTTGDLNPEDFGALQLIYVSADHRNVTTPTLEGWPDLQGRHGGLVWLPGPEGTKQLRRATKHDVPDIQPNCDRHQLAQILPSRNTPSTGEYICQGCRHRKTCRDGSGEFTFIFDRQQVLQEPRYRAHPSSLDPKTFVGSPEHPATVLIVDEASRLEFAHSFVVRPKDVLRAIEQISEHPGLEMVRNYLDYLYNLMGEKMPVHGYHHEAILECLPPVPDFDILQLEHISEQNLEFLEPGWVPPEKGGGHISDYPKEVQRFVRQRVEELTQHADETVDLRWMPEFFRSVGGEGRLRLSSEGLRITIPNQHLLNTLKHPHVKAVIFLDATGSTDQLEPWLGQEMAWIEGKMPEAGADIEITQVAGLKLMGFNRGAAQSRKAEALVNELMERHPGAAVIDAGSSSRLVENDGIWFRDSRGSNPFQQHEVLILVGAPIPNIGTMADEYALATGRSPGGETALRTYPIYAKNHTKSFYSRTLKESADEGFAQWVRWRTLGEIEQAIGRLRGNRRTGEKLRIYLLSDYPIDREVDLVGIETLAPKAMEAITASNPCTEGDPEYLGVSSNAIENTNSTPTSPRVPGNLTPADISDIDAILSEFFAIGLPPDFDIWLLGMSPPERYFVFGRARSSPSWRSVNYHRKREISQSLYTHAMRA